jgi:cell division septation protein DedD
MIYESFYSFIYTFSFIGELIGLSGRLAAIVGTAITVATGIIVLTVAYVSVTTRGSKSDEYPGMRRGESMASQLGVPPRTQGAPASAIGIPPAPLSPPIGITTPVQGLPDRLNLRSDWTNQRASLSWNEIQYDRGRYELEGFEVTRLYFDGSSTSANRMIADRLSPESRYWNGPFNQTYRWNTGGDIQGYRVDALFKEISSGPPRFLRVGETSHAPLS